MDLEGLIILLPAILLSLTIHEFAHGWMALKCGDSTARDMGRLTLNPIKHLDPLGTIMIIGTYLSHYIPFGWAKPVPIDPRNFGNPKRDIMLVSLAGPLSNILLALLSISLYRLLHFIPQIPLGQSIGSILGLLILVNAGLAFFNLLPFPPLDGSKILIGFLPNRVIPSYLYYSKYAGFGFIALLLLERMANIKTISYVLEPALTTVLSLISILVYGGNPIQ